MGFKDAKRSLVAALRAGNFVHEARRALQEKNLLAIGEVDADFVATIVLKTLSRDYAESKHHADTSVTVHTFKPTVERRRWYVKAYFLERPDGQATFISVHRSE